METEELNVQKEHSLKWWEKWWAEVIEHDCVWKQKGSSMEGYGQEIHVWKLGKPIPGKFLLLSIQQYAKSTGVKHYGEISTMKMLKKKLQLMCGSSVDFARTTVRDRFGIGYKGYRLPSEELCRKEFNDHVRFQYFL